MGSHLPLCLRRYLSRESGGMDEAYPKMGLWGRGVNIRLWEPYRPSLGQFLACLVPGDLLYS